MDIHISLHGRGELSARIYQQLREAILDGLLPVGSRVPPSRELARQLAVSRNTVAAAYDRLTAEGFLAGYAGAGTFVQAAPIRRARRGGAPAGGLRPRAVWAEVPAPPTPPASFDFRVGLPDAGLFPLATWQRLVGAQLRAPAARHADYADPAGLPAARAAIARHISLSRSVRAAPEDIVVTQGAQQALDLVGRVLLEPGTRVAVEEPGYPPARRLFRSLGARVAGVPVDAEGLDVTALPADARLVYVTPSHQFPLGTPMSLTRRAALLEWAERHGAAIVEDDYDSEFRFSERPLEPVQSLDRTGRVIYIGSFSKTLLPALRMGFLVAPASLRPALHAAKQLTDWHSDPVAQGALAEFIDEGLLGRHIRKATRVYAARHHEITTFVRQRLPDRLTLVPSAAGLHLCARAADPVDVEEAVRRARRTGVAVRTLDSFRGGTGHHPGLVIGYGAIDVDRVGEGLRRLAAAL